MFICSNAIPQVNIFNSILSPEEFEQCLEMKRQRDGNKGRIKHFPTR